MFLLMLFNQLLLCYIRSCMHLGVNLCVVEEVLVVLHKLSSCLFIQSALWEWHYQKTLHDLEDVTQ